MICINCGAEYEDSLVVCPYCGTENANAALYEHRGELDRIHERTEEVKKMKEKIAAQATRITGFVALGVVIFFLFILAGTYAAEYYRATHSLDIQNKELEEMELLYQAEDYETLYDEILESEYSYRAPYTKYYRVAMTYSSYQSDRDYLDSIHGYIADGYEDDEFLCNAFYYAFYDLYHMKTYEEEGFVYGEEDAITKIRDEYTEYLSENFFLTEAEIQEAVESFNEETTEGDFQRLAKLSQKRILDNMK